MARLKLGLVERALKEVIDEVIDEVINEGHIDGEHINGFDAAASAKRGVVDAAINEDIKAAIDEEFDEAIDEVVRF